MSERKTKSSKIDAPAPTMPGVAWDFNERSAPGQVKRSEPKPVAQTEVAYLRSLIDQNIRVTIKIRGREEVSGVIEYYDTSFIRLTRDGLPNLFIFKKDILYLRESA